MTTVINLNILNFVKLKLNNYTVNDTRTHNQYFDNRKQHYSSGHEGPGGIIDITPRTQLMAIGNQMTGAQDRAALVIPAEIDKTYDRKGNAVQYLSEKGARVNAYA